MMSEAHDWRRERLAVWLVAMAHGVSHFYMLLLVPLFPLFKAEWGISFVQLGAVLVVWNIVSVIAQAPVGFLVDKVGSRKLLVVALLMGVVGFSAAGIYPSFNALIFAAVIGGLANAVYHPADYDLLHHCVGSARVGRAFAIHSFVGYVGYGLAPLLMLGLDHAFGLRTALVGGALLGIVPALPLIFARSLDRPSVVETVQSDAAAVSIRRLLTPTVIGLTGFFALITLAGSGMQNFSIPALQQLDGLPLAVASIALTVFLVGNSVGVLIGGVLADKTSRHEDVAFGGYLVMAALIFMIGTINPGPYGVLAMLGAAGIAGGMIYPSRDMLVRKAAPPGAMGRTFGIVTTGFNLGGLVGPLMYGWLMDSGRSRMLFLVSAGMFVLTAIAPLITERRRKREVREASLVTATANL
jgi:MFS transporter, FSR family, fosmidomycin resistance protein